MDLKRQLIGQAVDRDPQSYAIIGAAMEVHRVLGPGFLEGVYQDAMEIELVAKGVHFVREQPIRVEYKGTVLGTPYRADFLCFDSLLVELKAMKGLTGVEEPKSFITSKPQGSLGRC